MSGRCSDCHREVIALYAVDGTSDRICVRCIGEAILIGTARTLEDIIAELRKGFA